MSNKLDKFRLFGDWIVLYERETYSRTAGGYWRKKPDSVERKVYTAEEYSRHIRSVGFFNNWGDGASCRAQYNYTCAGYIPNKVTTISPYKVTRTVDRFWFVSPRDLFRNAGIWERECVENAETWEEEFTQRGIEYTFYKRTKYDGIMDAATYCTRGDAWI